jgi:cytochrome c oxidase subunit 4
METTREAAVQVLPVNKEKIRKLVRIAVILGIITSIEFFLAVAMPKGMLLYAVFIGLTLVKAYYIVSEFMHLKYEVKILIWSVLLPVIFVIWFIIAMFTEGGSVFHLKGY